MMAWVAVGLLTGCLGIGCGGAEDQSEAGGSGGNETGGAGGQDGGSGGKAGKGGSAGTAGTGGSAGKGGSAGAAGTGGSAGKGGSAGAAGTGGSAGKGGSAGAAGTGGGAGTGGSAGIGGGAGTGGAAGTGGDAGAGGVSGQGGDAGSAGTGGQPTFCTPSATEACYTGPDGTLGQGLCAAGTRTCLQDGSAWGDCTGQVLPATETCETPGDDDCDGQTNEEGEGCTCVPGTQESCYSGSPSTKNVGICKGGMQTCNATGTGYGPCEGEVTPGTETCDAPEDEDCDGTANEEGASCVCVPGTAVECYSGPDGTQGVGLCTAGKKTCEADGKTFSACVGEVLPVAETCATEGDDDCDNQTNEEGEGCACVPGAEQECYSGPAATKGVGTCRPGTQKCYPNGTGWGNCEGEVTPVDETCVTPEDEDCDGTANESGESCLCVPQSAVTCYTGPAGTQNVGACQNGIKICNDLGTAFGACTGEVHPATETCNTPVDDDCDGQVNESGTGCTCLPGATQPCYSGPASTKDVGACHGGTQTCNAMGTGWGSCVGEVVPVTETCNNMVDDDCDGQLNESGTGCVCLPNLTGPCYTGPGGTQNVGICKGGTRVCNAQGTAWGACTGQVVPGTETCDNPPTDQDCDGQVNESGANCVCTPNSSAACYTGAAGTENVGLCHGGTKTCNNLGTAYGACTGQVTPAAETCNTPGDDDCDGQTNESGAGCACTPNATQPCYSGPANTKDVGLCHGGTQTCNAQGTGWGSCAGEVVPAPEVCANLLDEDCNGTSNNGCNYLSCKDIKDFNPSAASGIYTIDTDGAGARAPFNAYCDMDTDGGGYTMVRFTSATLGGDQNAYAALCASYGLEVIVPRTKAHAAAIYKWNGDEVPNLYNVFPKYNGATTIFNWQGICKGAPCTFWMTDNANGDVSCGGLEPNGDNNTANRIYKWNSGCGIQGGWNDANNTMYYTGWVVCSANDK